MSITIKSVPVPKSSRTVTSKYDFAALVAGSSEAIVETEVVNVDKAKSKLTSALVAYRQRTGDKSKFTVRPFKNEDGTDAVGVWKLADAPAAPAA